MARRGYIGLAAVLVLVCGCNGAKKPDFPKTYPVRGKITLNGQPVQWCRVDLIPKSKNPAAEGVGRSDQTGYFAIRTFQNEGFDGAIPGEYIVVITPLDGSERTKDQTPTTVPEKYSSAETSDITVRVEEKDNDLKVDIKG